MPGESTMSIPSLRYQLTLFVMPGMFPTDAFDFEINEFSNNDLPTFGIPTTASLTSLCEGLNFMIALRIDATPFCLRKSAAYVCLR